MASKPNMNGAESPMDSNPDGQGEKARYVPVNFKDEDEFLRYVRKEFDADVAYDRSNRDAALDDLQFVGMDQWDPQVRAARTKMGRPCLSVNVLPQFIGQVIGDRRINKTSIKVTPRKDATVAMAETRSDIIKSIEAYSRAERVYDNACEDQVTCGISNFRIALDYADNDVFEQDIFIRHIPNPLAVVWDRMSFDPTGRDARHCFVQDVMPRDVYDTMYPDQPCPTELNDSTTASMMQAGWFAKDFVRVTEFWRMIERMRTLALYQDGSVVDITDMDPAEYEQLLYRDPRTGQPRIRKAPRQYAQMHLVTGFAILEGPYELPITRVPIIKVTGREIRVGEDRVRFGLVRFAKDAQRLKNYWRSVMAETLALAPKAQWIASAKAVKGREDEFRDAHLSGDPLLIYNEGDAPQRMAPPPIPAALLQEVQMNTQDIKDTTGLQDASLGMRSNEISGRAINARKQEGDVATVIYHDNLNASIQEGGDVVNQLLGVAYDTTRVMRAIGADDKHKLITVNDPSDPDSIDLTVGKYDVSVITGPSYTTARQEAAEAMMNAIQVAPQLMQIAGDLIVKNQDWPGAQEIAERLKRSVPPQLLGPDDQDPNAQAQAQEAQAQQQQAQQVQMAEMSEQMQHASDLRKIELAEKQASLLKSQADAEAAAHNATKAEAEAHEASVRARHAPLKHLQELEHAERTVSARTQPTNNGSGHRPGGGRPNKTQPKGKNK